MGRDVTLRWKPMPQPSLVFLRETVVRLKDGEAISYSPAAEFILPYLHLLSVPALDTPLVDREGGICDDKRLVYAYDLAIPLAFRACTCRGVEREHIV